MKLVFVLSIFVIITAAMTGCSDSSASSAAEPATPPENGAQFKEGKGVALTPLMAQSIRLQTAEVQEETVAPVFTIAMQAVQGGTRASGWLTADRSTRHR